MAYLVLARKYRPQSFEEVVGQQHVTQTLANAVTSGRLAHAILLSGPRGTGKTTVARILAKCINCETGPTPTPCNTCVSCSEITAGNCPDVFEIDGASNNKVENIRELRSNARYMPAKSPYKIYIIDEVHMLSDSAFNALLKILEEPPAHVLFFFATTEPQKIPITIHSRCQRYDFRRVALNAISQHFANICKREGIEISEKGLSIIAREADGSIRDGLSLLDQIITCATGSITEHDIIDLLGVIDRQLLFDVSEALFSRDMARLLAICDMVYSQGRDLLKFYSELTAHLRNLMVIRMGGDEAALPDVASHELDLMKKQVSGITEPYLGQILDTMFEDEWRIRQSSSPKLALEMTFFKLIAIRPALSIDSLIEKLEHLKKRIVPDNPKNDISEPKAAPVSAAISGPEKQSPVKDKTDNREKTEAIQPEKQEQAGKQSPEDIREVREEEKPGPTAPIYEMPMDETWEKLYTWLSGESPTIGSCLSGGRLKKIEGNRVEIEVSSTCANIHLLNLKQTREHINQLCTRFFNRPVHADIKIDQQAMAACENLKKNRRNAEEESLSHPMVRALIKKFDARVVAVRPTDS
ncbi:MAG: DNA polymerase III subunit gamma/tau [Deltaproteobacteria bacterium]|nr:DNA polymerase III subunit gamma/tau [Deltaproteobacteria bacterium]